MIVTIHQPEHLPWLGYFHKMAQADLYVFLDNVQYRHRYFQNRNRIIGAKEPIWVTAPVLKEEHRYGPIMSVRLDNDRHWRKTYWESVAFNYGRHPYFAMYEADFKLTLMTPHDSLCELNIALIGFCQRALGITTRTIRASELEVSGQKTELLHQICQSVDATCYMSGPSGRDYLDEAPFQRSGIEVRYHEFAHPVYPQHHHAAFCSHLSAIDLLMNCGPKSADLLLEQSRRSLAPTI